MTMLDDLGLMLVDQATADAMWNLADYDPDVDGDDLWWVALSARPEEPARVITLYERPGLNQRRGFRQTGMRRPGLQVIVRSPSYVNARDKADAIYLLFDSIANQTINGVFYGAVDPPDEPAPVGEDDDGRQLVSVNFQVWRGR